MLRVTGGRWRGRPLKTPPRGVRPTSDRVRQALFNMLGVEIENTVFWDLFAGTGTVGLEALSRGARQVVLCEKKATARNALEANCKKLNAGETAEIIAGDVIHELRRLEHRPKPDFIFLDPPYAQTDLLLRLIRRLARSPIAEVRPLVIVEHHSRTELPAEYQGWRTIDVRRYGDTSLSFLTLEEAPSSSQNKPREKPRQ